jgi:hypothetical protein
MKLRVLLAALLLALALLGTGLSPVHAPIQISGGLPGENGG